MFGAWAFLFVCFLHWQAVHMLSRLLLQQKLHTLKKIKKSQASRSFKKRWSDNKAEFRWHQTASVSHTQAHTASHLLAPYYSFARGTTNGSFLNSQNQLQHTCLLLSNSLLFFHELQWPQAAGDRDTCNSSHPLAQIPTPFFLLGYKCFPGLSFTTTEPLCTFDQRLHRACFLSLLAMPLFRRIKHLQAIQAFDE